MGMVPFIGGGMPAWLASALRMLVGTPVRAVGTGAVVGTVAERFNLPSIFGGGGDGLVDGKPRRRRRRRALTASDRADIAFIAGMLGQPAGRQFAMLIGSRTAS